MSQEIIINVTQHHATPEQVAAGVIDPIGSSKGTLQKLLTIDQPDFDNLDLFLATRAKAITIHLAHCDELWMGEELDELDEDNNYKVIRPTKALIGGFMPLMPHLANALKYHLNLDPVYAFTKRIVEEKDGVKKSIFHHEGFIPHFFKPLTLN